MSIDEKPVISRRAALRQTCCGFGMLGLTGQLSKLSATEPTNPLTPRPPHFRARAKRVIFLFMHGGPSSIDTFDYKPALAKCDGKPLPFKRPLTFAEGKVGGLMKSPWEFRSYGQSGIKVSDLFPHIGSCVDDICVMHSVVGDSVAHGGASLQLHTGSNTFTRPSMGSWALYGLGSENQNLPGFITIKRTLAHGGAKNWSSAFLPAPYQETALGNAGFRARDLTEPIENLVSNLPADIRGRGTHAAGRSAAAVYAAFATAIERAECQGAGKAVDRVQEAWEESNY